MMKNPMAHFTFENVFFAPHLFFYVKEILWVKTTENTPVFNQGKTFLFRISLKIMVY